MLIFYVIDFSSPQLYVDICAHSSPQVPRKYWATQTEQTTALNILYDSFINTLHARLKSQNIAPYAFMDET